MQIFPPAADAAQVGAAVCSETTDRPVVTVGLDEQHRRLFPRRLHNQVHDAGPRHDAALPHHGQRDGCATGLHVTDQGSRE